MNWTELLAVLLGAAGGIGGTFFALRDKMHQSDTTAAIENAKQDIIATLMQERDEAREEAREAQERRASLIADVSRLQEMVASANRDYLRVSAENSVLMKQLLGSTADDNDCSNEQEKPQ
jgi:hypothetical protein